MTNAPTTRRLIDSDNLDEQAASELLVTALQGVALQYVALAELVDATVLNRLENQRLLAMLSAAHFANARVLAHLGEDTLGTLLGAIGRHPSGGTNGGA